MKPETIDPTIKALVSAIGEAETGTSSPEAYTKRGASGEFGRYQFMPETWKARAGKYLGNSNAEMSIENQNKVQYDWVKEQKDLGYTPAQIASMHNAGEGRPNAYKEDFRGVNSQGVAYDVPSYVQKVSQAYQQKKGGAPVQYQTEPAQPISSQEDLLIQPPEQSGVGLGEQLGNRMQKASDALTKGATGEQNIASGFLQTLGQAAGGVGDIVSAGVGIIPGVKQVEEWIGKGISKGLSTDTGQALLSDYEKFATEHPELAANIGASANIASMIPLIKGVSLAAKSAIGLKDNLFVGSIEKGAKNELETALGRNLTGRKLLGEADKRDLDSINTLVANRTLPDVVEDANGIARYNTANAKRELDASLDADEAKLQQILESATGEQVAGYVPLSEMKNIAIEELKKELKGSPDLKKALKQIEKDFDSFSLSYGDLVTLTELNDIKRMVRKSVNFNSPLVDQNVRFNEGQAMMRVIEEVAEKRGMPEVRAVNKEMASKIHGLKILGKLEGASVPENPGWRTLVGRRGGDMSTIAGEAVGQAFGIPGVGAAAGRGLSSRVLSGKKSKIGKLRGLTSKRKSSLLEKSTTLTPLLLGGTRESQEQRKARRFL